MVTILNSEVKKAFGNLAFSISSINRSPGPFSSGMKITQAFILLLFYLQKHFLVYMQIFEVTMLMAYFV